MVKILATILISSSISIGTCYFLFGNQKKVAFVNSDSLIYTYEGTVEAMAKFNNTREVMNANLDTLKNDFQREVTSYSRDYKRMSISKRTEREELLRQQETRLQEYSQLVKAKIEEEDNKMMQEVLDQINVFVAEYASQHDYDIIFGATGSGNVMYGHEQLDITEEVLSALNDKYRGR